MIDSKKINEAIDSVVSSIPQGVKNIPQELKSYLKSGLSRSLADMDLVTREEFDVQVKVLEQTRAQCEALEQQLKQLLDQK